MNNRILMIEDDLSIIRSIKIMLELDDIKTDFYLDPNELLKNIDIIDFSIYDLIVCDYKMPEINGVFIFQEIINRVPIEKLPKNKILYTGNKGQLSVMETKILDLYGVKIFFKSSNDLDLLFEELYNL